MTKSKSSKNSQTICKIMGAIHDPEQFPSVISGLKNCLFYAYIVHDHDIYSDDDFKKGVCTLLRIGCLKSPHLHFMAIDRNSKTFNTWGELLGIPSNMVQKMQDPRGMARYLIHKDNPEKYQYDEKSIITNNLDKLTAYLSEEDSSTVLSQYKDFINLRRGVLTPNDFLNLHRGRISTLGFYQRLRLFADLEDNYNSKGVNK